MNLLDIILLAVAAFFIFIGIKRGFVEEIFRLAAMVIGFSAACFFYKSVFIRLGFLSLSDNIKSIVSFIIVYLLAAIIVLTAGWFLKKLIHLTLLGWVDRLCGGCIGFVKGFLISWIAVLILSALPSSGLNDSLEQSSAHRLFTGFPPNLTIEKAKKTGKSLNKIMNNKTLEKLDRTKEKFDRFKSKVDSARHESI